MNKMFMRVTDIFTLSFLFKENQCSDYPPGREAGKHPGLETWHRQTLRLWVSLAFDAFDKKKRSFFKLS